VAPESNPIWITGAAGLIGGEVLRQAKTIGGRQENHAAVIGLTRERLDLTDFPKVRTAFERDRPQLIIHCAALSQSNECQANPPLARKLNVDLTAMLADLAKSIPFIFFSTDLVFDGAAGNYDESSAVGPLSVYGETKVAAERIVLANPLHTVIRTSINGGTSPGGNRGFNEQLRRAWQAGQALRLFTDEFRNPIAASVTARAVWQLAASKATGIFHIRGSQRLSRFQIGQLLARRWPELNPKIEPAPRSAHRGAPRPADTSLNCARVQRLLSFSLPGLAEWLEANPDVVF
jgi:dTDP-4-dehydrorhamnose reductase